MAWPTGGKSSVDDDVVVVVVVVVVAIGGQTKRKSLAMAIVWRFRCWSCGRWSCCCCCHVVINAN